MNFEHISSVEESEPLYLTAANIEKDELGDEKRSGTAKAVIAAMAMLTQAACATHTVSMSRIVDEARPLQSPDAYCNQVDDRISSYGSHRFERTIETAGGTVIMRGIKNENGKNMTVEIVRPNGTHQRIDCK